MQQTRTLKLGPQFRTLDIERRSIDEGNRTIPLAFSSENPVERYWGIEILDHSPGAVRMGRLQNGAPLLCDHDTRCQVGKVEEARIDAKDRMGRASCRFSKANPRAEQEYQDVLDEIRTKVSVGYIIHAMVLESEVDGVCTYRITDWEPFEITLCSVEADTKTGVNRMLGERSTSWEETEITVTVKSSKIEQEETEAEATDESSSDPAEMETETKTCDTTHKGGRTMSEKIEVAAHREEGGKVERTRVAEILAIADKYPQLKDAARSFISEGKPLDEFRTFALETVHNPTPVAVSSEIGMSTREKKEYSLLRAFRSFLAPGEATKWDGLEREASEATAKLCKREAKGFFIPQDILTTPFSRSMSMMQQRNLTAGSFGSGGALVDSEIRVADMIELLRNKALVSRMGARTLSGLVGNIAIPRVTGGATAYWLPESGTVTASDQAFGQLGLVPHRLVGDTGYSKELLMQSSVDVEGFVREDLMRVLAIEKDRVAINGLGAAGEPRGILNTTGVGSVTFGAAPTWAKVVDFETQVGDANADVDTMGYLTTPKVKGAWKTTPKVTNQAVFLWENGNIVNGFQAAATKQVPSEKVIFGNWNDLIIAEWAGIDVVVDPYSLKKQGLIEITVTMWTDCGVRHAASFCVSTDAGNQ